MQVQPSGQREQQRVAWRPLRRNGRHDFERDVRDAERVEAEHARVVAAAHPTSANRPPSAGELGTISRSPCPFTGCALPAERLLMIYPTSRP